MANQISEHEIRIYEAARESSDWMTARELATASDVADRTARAHCSQFAELGLFEVKKLFGGYRYRLSSNMGGVGMEYLRQLEEAKRVLG